MHLGHKIHVLALSAFVATAGLSLSANAQAVSPGEVERALSTADDLSIAFEHAAGQVAPSVVNIRAAKRIASSTAPRETTPFGSPFGDSPFREFFGGEFFERFRVPAPGFGNNGGLIRQGQGTGFVVSEDGYILTNNHVVDGATEIIVQFGDDYGGDREYDAEIVGADPATDLALIRINADNLTPVEFADSDDLRVGSWVVAMGNPFGLELTITAGIVSATGRTRMGITDYEDFIQTDAAINPGNSGGPLVNLRGEVVGVNTAIATRSGGNMGIGFAIPSNLAQLVMVQLREDGSVTRGWLGVVIQDLTEDLAESFGFQGTEGVLVSQVQEDSPADDAGLKVGDIITKFNGEGLTGMDQLRLRVASTEPGDEVEVVVVRDGREKTIDVEIGELQAAERASSSSTVGDELGLTLRDLDDRLAEQLGIDADDGVVVASVDPLSPGARAGLRPRDVITHVHGTRIRSTNDFHRALDKHDLADGVRLTVRTGNAQRFVFIRLTDRS